MTPGLEQAAVASLQNEYPSGVFALLQNAGSSAAEQPLWDAFENLCNTLPKGSNVGAIEESFVQVLSDGSVRLVAHARETRPPQRDLPDRSMPKFRVERTSQAHRTDAHRAAARGDDVRHDRPVPFVVARSSEE